MPDPRVWEHEVFESVAWQPMDRFVGLDQSTLTTSVIASIELRIYSVRDLELVYEKTGIAPGSGSAEPWFNTLQTDARWRPGPPGYNFRYTILPTATEWVSRAISGHDYRLEVLVNTSSDGPVRSAHLYRVRRVLEVSA